MIDGLFSFIIENVRNRVRDTFSCSFFKVKHQKFRKQYPAQSTVLFTFIPWCIKKIRWWNLESKCMYSRWSHGMFFKNQILMSHFDRMGENFCSNELSAWRILKTLLQSPFRSRSDKNQPSKFIHRGISPPVYYTHLDSCSKTAIQCKQLTGWNLSLRTYNRKGPSFRSFEAGTQLNAIYTDFHTAFDSSPHYFLLAYLSKLGFGDGIISWLSSYLSTSGVLQDCVLSSLLFFFSSMLFVMPQILMVITLTRMIKMYLPVSSSLNCLRLQCYVAVAKFHFCSW